METGQVLKNKQTNKKSPIKTIEETQQQSEKVKKLGNLKAHQQIVSILEAGKEVRKRLDPWGSGYNTKK